MSFSSTVFPLGDDLTISTHDTSLRTIRNADGTSLHNKNAHEHTGLKVLHQKRMVRCIRNLLPDNGDYLISFFSSANLHKLNDLYHFSSIAQVKLLFKLELNNLTIQLYLSRKIKTINYSEFHIINPHRKLCEN